MRVALEVRVSNDSSLTLWLQLLALQNNDNSIAFFSCGSHVEMDSLCLKMLTATIMLWTVAWLECHHHVMDCCMAERDWQLYFCVSAGVAILNGFPVSAGADGCIKLWDATASHPVLDLHTPRMQRVNGLEVHKQSGEPDILT
jgi:hypothetical protein